MIQHPFLFSDALQVLAAAIRPEKEMKGILTGNREMKLSLSADHLCRKSKKKKKNQPNNFWNIQEAIIDRFQDTKVNIQKSITFLHTRNKQVEFEV